MLPTDSEWGRGMRTGRLTNVAWFLAWALGSSAWCGGAGRELGATFDEPVYVQKGLEGWRTGSRAALMKLGTMPLPIDVTTLPLYAWERWQGTKIDPETDLARVLPWARLGTQAFWWLLLVHGWQAGWQLGGRWGARLAVALLACEPSLLAHASLATTDIAASACLLALVYHFRMGREAVWRWRVGVPALWFGATVLAKASGLVFGPLCLAAVELERLLSGKTCPSGSVRDQEGNEEGRPTWLLRAWAGLGPLRRDGAQIIALGIVLVFVYCGCDWRVQPSFVKWAHGLPAGPTASAMAWVADHLRAFPNAGEGLVRQVTHNVRGHGVYLLGHTAPRAVWYYFPVALAIKLSLPLLILTTGLVVMRPRTLGNWACLAAGLLLLFSMTYRVQIGVRLVLPLVTLGIVGLSGALATVWHRGTVARPGWALRAAVAGGVAWAAWSALAVWPHGLCYANELWGGTAKGYLRLSDSNYDWGQGLPELVRWERQHGLACIDIWYMGTDPALLRLPVHPIRFEQAIRPTPEETAALLQGRCLAASTTQLYGSYGNTEGHRAMAAYLRACRPVGRTQTYLIYDFRGQACASGGQPVDSPAARANSTASGGAQVARGK